MPNEVEKRQRVGGFETPDQGTSTVSRTCSDTAFAGRGYGWTRSSQCKHRTWRGRGRADIKEREPLACDAGPLTEDKRLTGFGAACKERGTRMRAGA